MSVTNQPRMTNRSTRKGQCDVEPSDVSPNQQALRAWKKLSASVDEFFCDSQSDAASLEIATLLTNACEELHLVLGGSEREAHNTHSDVAECFRADVYFRAFEILASRNADVRIRRLMSSSSAQQQLLRYAQTATRANALPGLLDVPHALSQHSAVENSIAFSKAITDCSRGQLMAIPARSGKAV